MIFYMFARWRPSAILDSLCACLDDQEGHFVVFITAQNLAGIDTVASRGLIGLCMFSIFCDLGLKTPIHGFVKFGLGERKHATLELSLGSGNLQGRLGLFGLGQNYPPFGCLGRVPHLIWQVAKTRYYLFSQSVTR